MLLFLGNTHCQDDDYGRMGSSKQINLELAVCFPCYQWSIMLDIIVNKLIKRNKSHKG